MNFIEFQQNVWQEYNSMFMHVRAGQHLMNQLWLVGKKDIYNSLVRNGMDPFYGNHLIPEAMKYIELNWDK
jgi:hypothetical protein